MSTDVVIPNNRSGERHDIINRDNVKSGFSECTMSNIRMVPTTEYGTTTKKDKIWIDVSNGQITFSWIPNQPSLSKLATMFGNGKDDLNGKDLEGKSIKLVISNENKFKQDMIVPEKA
jgi:hypothetical protein